MMETRHCDGDDNDHHEACDLLAALRRPVYRVGPWSQCDHEACDMLAALRRPVYRVGPWSACEPLTDHHPVGRRHRAVNCVDELGRPSELA